MSNSSSTFSLSIRRDHKIYRSRPVKRKEFLPRSNESSIVRSPCSALLLRSQRISECSPHGRNEENVYFKNPQDLNNHLQSQNTAVVGSVKNACDNFSRHPLDTPDNTSPIKKCACIDTTTVNHGTKCIQDKLHKSSCQSRHCCINYQNDCHCCQHYNSCCWRSSCHSQPCTNVVNCSCSLQTHTCSQRIIPEKRGCRSIRCTSYVCGNHAQRVCSQNYLNPIPCCSAPCNAVEYCCCRRFTNRLCSCTDFFNRQHCLSKCYNHYDRTISNKCSYHYNKNALKSLEKSIEKRPDHMKNKVHMDCSGSDSAIEAAERTRKWVQEWTPSLGHSPSVEEQHSKAKVLPPTLKNNSSSSSESSTDSDLETNKSRKRMRTVQKGLDCNKNLTKTLAPNSSQSTTSDKGARAQSEYKNTNKLFNPQNNNHVNGKFFIEESTPFSSGQTEFDKNLSSENRLPSSDVQEKPNLPEVSENSKKMNKMDVVQNGSQQENSSKEIEVSSGTNMSPREPKQTDNTDDLSQNIFKFNMKKLSGVSSGTLLPSHLDHINGQNVINQPRTSPEKSVIAGNCEEVNKISSNQSKKSSEETFPELRLDSLSDDKPSSNETPITDSSTQPIQSESHEVVPEETSTINENNPSGKNEEKTSHNKSLSLTDYSKIKLSDIANNEENKKSVNTVESKLNGHSTINSKCRQTFSECDDQMELVCESKLKKRKRRKKRNASERASRSTGSAKSVEMVDLGHSITNQIKDTVQSQVPNPATIHDDQSNSSQNLKISSSEKWCLKPLHELRLSPSINEAYLKVSK